MKHGLLAFLIPLFCIWSVNSGFKPTTAAPSYLSQLKQDSDAALLELDQTMRDLLSATQSSDAQQTRALFHQARRIYKNYEFLYEYFHHSAIKKHINGAPLPQIEQKVADLNIFRPQGFQRMEEVIYEAHIDWDELRSLSKEFLQHLDSIIKYHQRIQLYDRHVLEAVRYELIRVYTLGLTGFENPASDSALAEAQRAFAALEAPASYYAQQLSADHAKKVAALFNHSKPFFEASFNDFDRLGFLKEVNDPLFDLTLSVHLALGVETHEEVNTAPTATNYLATSLFDINLLNKDYFGKYPERAITEAQRELGRTLFFDPALSFNNSLSCSSCHHPDKAFTDGKPKSLSNDQSSEVDRNAPTLVNALFAGAYFHDLRAGKLAMQTEHVMINPKEFNVRPLELAEKLQQSEGYKTLFAAAYPGIKQPIEPRTIKSALSAYVGSLVSWNSEFDQYVRNERESIDEEVKKGYNLFMGKATCGTCHFAPNFSGIVPPFYDDTESEVLGVPSTNDTINPSLDPDLGRYKNGIRAEHAEHFRHSFKTVTVRNVALTAPYFHNGAYLTLEEVIWFYNKGGGQGIGLDVPNQTLPPDTLGLTEEEISAVIAFMKSLTDVEAFQAPAPALPDFEAIPELQNRTAMAY